MSLNKTIRLRTTPGSAVGPNIADNNIQFKIEQEFDTLDILSLKITQADAYRNFCSDYGVVVGRVIANDGFGVENAKVSIFIPLSDEDEDRSEITTIYPYRRTTDTNGQGIRYNLLPRDGRVITEYLAHPITPNPNNDDNYSCSHNGVPLEPWVINQISGVEYEGDAVWSRQLELDYGPKVPVGTFPSKSDILDNDTILEVYDKYYKFTTTTNASGDYMLFGIPTGTQTIHMDVDLSDTGNVSLSVQDFINAGFPQNLFNGNEFTSSTNLDALPQIESRDTSIDVIPFWGNLDQCEIGITRLDFNLNKTVIPSAALCFFSFTNGGNRFINKNCNINGSGQQNDQNGYSDIGNMVGFNTTTTAINWGQGGTYTQPSVAANTIIKVPMSEERYITNEFGDYVPSPDPSKGIPTAGRYRFYINPTNQQLTGENARASYIFPDYTNGGPAYVKLKYDLVNRQTRYYTVGNKNFSCDSDSNDCRRWRIKSVNEMNGSSNKDYPMSAKDVSGQSIFGRGYVCYGSLYFPRFEDDNGDVCSLVVSESSDVNVQNAAGRKYSDGALQAYSLLDITFLMKKFQTFGGTLPISSHAHNIGTFLNGSTINPYGYNGLDLQNETYPLRNDTLNPVGSITFPKALNNEQNPVANNTIISYATCYNDNSGCNGTFLQNIQLGISSLPGRYFFYFGLTDSNNILKFIKDNEDV